MTYKIIVILGLFLSSISHGEKRTELTFSSEPGNHYHGFCTALLKNLIKSQEVSESKVLISISHGPINFY